MNEGKVRRWLFLMLGWLCVVLAVVGTVLPLMPTVPFLLGALFCFDRSSPRFHSWLLRWRFLTVYWENYRERCGVPRRVKVWSLVVLWSALGGSALLWDHWLYRWLLLAVGLAVTTHLLLLKTK